jgi:cellulose synthase/poly-beta-1,6-N-acetylglucosamine synthase-like glycosyltransferase
MEVLGYIIFVIYFISLVYVTIFCLMQLHLLFVYLSKNKGTLQTPTSNLNDSDLPLITVQLPIFNEQYVVERLIDNIIKLDYPQDKIQIHILDDSTDETLEITKRKVSEYKTEGYNIECITRSKRTGFKAGALRDAMVYANGEFIAIFDADFLPKTDFLKATISQFQDSKVGVVQTRWEHINQHHSLLTEMQAMQLNAHFTIEQKGRFQADYLLQFNGTAGIWRRTCIDDAGGWEADTLTEDLDLSYRAQMKGWQIIYLENVTAPAELPVEINGLKSQQYRWMKGGAETARKLLPKVWASDVTLRQKFQATVHLMASSIFIFVFLIGVFSVPVLFIIAKLEIDTSKFSGFLIALLSIIAVYFVANVGVAWPKQNKAWMILKFIVLFPIFLALSMGIAFHNMIAVIQGFMGKSSSFVRTPKYGITNKAQKINQKSYFSGKFGWIAICEGLLSIYFFAAVYYGFVYDYKSFYAMHFLLGIGYLMLFYYAIESRFSKR